MKNHLIKCLIIFLLVSCVEATEEYRAQISNKYPKENIVFNGKVKQATSTSHHMDSNGNIRENKCEEICVKYAPNGAILLYTEYNDSNEFGDFILYRSDEYTLKDRSYEISQCKSTQLSDGVCTLVCTYEGDLLVGEFFSDRDNVPKNIYKYNTMNQLVEELSYSVTYSADKPWVVKTYSYDDNDRIASMTLKNAIGDVEKEKYTYDENSNIAIVDYCGTNPFHSKITKKYNENNDVVLEESYGTNCKVIFKRSYTYEYDEFNNWRTRIIRTSNNINIKTVRDIEYYQ